MLQKGNMDIKNRVALVTGAASGIGSAVANELAWRGAKMIALVDMSERIGEVAESNQRQAFRGRLGMFPRQCYRCRVPARKCTTRSAASMDW